MPIDLRTSGIDQYFERILALEKRVFEFLRVGVKRDTCGLGIPYRLVVDICQIHDLRDIVSAVFQRPPQDILEYVGPEISDMRVIVYGRPAGV